MTERRKRATEEAAGVSGLALLVAICGLAAWGLLAAAAVAALIPVAGTAAALALVAVAHALVALAAGLRIRAVLRAAAERRRARMVNVALIRSALMLFPGGRRPAARRGIAAILAVIALALFLAPGRRPEGQGEKPEG
jgi:hypothetical protein